MAFRLLKIFRSPTDDILRLLNNNVIGTPGKSMRYQHLHVNDKIYKIANPYFVNLIRKTKVIGSCCFCSRPVVCATQSIQSFYIRYFSFDETYRSNGKRNRLSPANSAIRKEIREVLKGRDLGVAPHNKFFHYAYVDPENVRSAALCNSFGFETVRQFTTLVFNRVFPSTKQRIEEVTGDDVVVRRMLADFYKDFNMFSLENFGASRKYYVIRDLHGRILAGAQANPDAWQITSLPGIAGKLLPIFSHLPVFNRLINKRYRFIAIEGIYWAAGYEELLEELFGALLTRYNVYTALIVLDANSFLYDTLKKLDLGIVNGLNKKVNGAVICNFTNFDEDEKQKFRDNPAYISAIDVT